MLEPLSLSARWRNRSAAAQTTLPAGPVTSGQSEMLSFRPKVSREAPPQATKKDAIPPVTVDSSASNSEFLPEATQGENNQAALFDNLQASVNNLPLGAKILQLNKVAEKNNIPTPPLLAAQVEAATAVALSPAIDDDRPKKIDFSKIRCAKRKARSESVEDSDSSDGSSRPKKPKHAPERRPRATAPAKYTSREIKSRPSYNINQNKSQATYRSQWLELAAVTQVIKSVAEAPKKESREEMEVRMDNLRTELHQLEFRWYLSMENINKAKLLNGPGISRLFTETRVFPHDIATDAQALYNRWVAGDFVPDLLRGIDIDSGTLASGKKRTAYKLRPEYPYKKSAGSEGHNGLFNGQWWPSRLTALRDGAHGHTEGGIYGQKGTGVFSVVVSAGGYADEDHGEIIKYCGTESTSAIPTDNTALLQEARKQGWQIRVIRGANSKSKYAPRVGYRYDGLYTVTGEETLDSEKHIARFTLTRMANQHPIRYFGTTSRPHPQELEKYENIKAMLKGSE